jgi:sugar phosphate isomerase/epimerase
MKLCATTVMIPECDLLETCVLLRKYGYQGVEWRVRRIPESAKNASEYSPWGKVKNDLTPERFLKEAREIRKICDDHGLAIAAIAPQARADQLDEVKLLVEGAAAVAGRGERPPLVRIGAPRGYDRKVNYNVLYEEAVEAYGRAIEISRPYGVRIIMEIHNGTIMVSASLAHRIACRFDPKDIGVIYDVNNMVKDGLETPRLGMELLGPYLAHVHCGAHVPVPGERDERGAVKWKWTPAPLSDGLLHIPTVVDDLKAVGFDGFVSVEDFGPGPAEPKLAAAAAFLKKLGIGA